MYTVVGHANTRALRVLWMLEELGQPYDMVPALPRSEEALKFNPTGKVPVLLVDDAPIIDSVAILTYLADHHGALTCPAGTVPRARQDSLTLLILDEIEGLLWMSGRHSFALPAEHRVPAIKDSLRWEFARNMKRLVPRMGDGPFLMGDQMTVPDILLTHCVIWARRARFDIDEPVVADYAARLMTRPAFLRAQAHQAE